MIPKPPKFLSLDEATLSLSVKTGGYAANFIVRFDNQGGGVYPVLDLEGCEDENSPGHTARLALDAKEWTELAAWMNAVCDAINKDDKKG